MLLVELIKQYAGQHKTDKAILGYLETESLVVRYDVGVEVEDVTEEWILMFQNFAGEDHARRIKRSIEFVKPQNKH